MNCTPLRFQVGDKLEIHSIPSFSSDAMANGEIVVVLECYPSTSYYSVLFKSGLVRPCPEKFLRPFPPVLPNGRGNMDNQTSWEEFQKETGINPAAVKNPPTDRK